MKIRRKLRFLHRWLGLLTSLWIVQLALTGLLLQQSNNLSLDQHYVSAPWVLEWYGYGQNTQSFNHRNEVIYQVDNRLLIHDKVVRMPQTIKYAARNNKEWVLVTGQAMYGINTYGEINWRIDDFDGLPTPIDNLHVADEIMIRHDSQWYQINPQMQIKAVPSPNTNINKAQKNELDARERKQVLAKTLSNVLSYDKVLADIHAGYKGSSWLNTLSALALLYLSFSGLVLFFRSKNKSRKISQ